MQSRKRNSKRKREERTSGRKDTKKQQKVK